MEKIMNNLSLDSRNWDAFFIEDVAEILSGRDIYERERLDGLIPYITATANNNGIGYFVANSNETLESNCLSVNRNGSVGYCFYHPYKALYGNDTRKLRPKKNNKFSRKLYNPYTVFYHTFFDLKLVYEVGPESFFPPPTVKSALLNIKRKQLFFDFKFKAKYLAFISCLLEKPDLSVKTALKSIFRKSQVRSISEKFGLNLNAQIVCLSPSQWVNCFLEMLEVVPEKFHPS